MTGRKRVLEACQELAISESRFLQLRQELLQAALARLERRPAGRPRRMPAALDENALQAELADMELALATAQLREELALAGIVAGPEPVGAEKKRPSRSRRRARLGWWKK